MGAREGGAAGGFEGDSSKLRFFLEPSLWTGAGTFCGHGLRLLHLHYFTHSSPQKARFGKMKFVSNYIFVAKAGRGQLKNKAQSLRNLKVGGCHFAKREFAAKYSNNP